jgi:hypothetical protein
MPPLARRRSKAGMSVMDVLKSPAHVKDGLETSQIVAVGDTLERRISSICERLWRCSSILA